MSVKQQRPTRRIKVAGHNRPRPAMETEQPVDSTEQPSTPSTLADDTDLVDDEFDEAAPPRPRWPLALVIVAAVLAGAGVFFTVKASSGGDPGVDTQAMTEVNGQVKAGLEKIFSFSYDKVDPNVAHDVLAGAAVGEYDKLIQQVRAEAPAQKLVLATRVTTTGVKSIDGDRAELLVFLDQVATRVDTGKTSGSAAALSVTAEKQDGSWRIVSLIPR